MDDNFLLDERYISTNLEYSSTVLEQTFDKCLDEFQVPQQTDK